MTFLLQVGSKWPPESWMADSPFLFAGSGKGVRALDPETPTGSHRPNVPPLGSPLSSPGSVDLRRHSAYMRPFDQVQTRDEEKDRLLRQPHIYADKSNMDYSQHSLPRHYVKGKVSNPPQRANVSGSSSFGFSSSTLNPRHFPSHTLTKSGSTLGQGVTKPSSHITHQSSDHESSV